DDLFNGDNYYAEQIKLEYDAWKELNPDQDFSQKEYQLAAVNTRAFEYESIRNQQESKEFWGQIAALVVIVGVSLVCPPAGIALGAVYGTFELSSAVSGKDWISGRELGTGERVFRGLLSPLDIIPGVSSVTKFSGAVKLAHVGDMGQFAIKTGIKSSINDGVTHIRNMVETAGKMSTTRLKSTASAIKDVPNKLKNKLIDDTIEVGRFIDSAITHTKNITSTRRHMDFAMDGFGNMGNVQKPVENSHAAENYFTARLKKNGINGGGAGNKNVHRSEIDEVIKNDYDINGNLINRSIVPKGYDSVEDFLKVVDDTTIKEYGYDSIEEFKEVVGYVDDYLNASPKNNIINKGLAGGTHVKGVDYDVLGFPIFKGENLKFTLKLDEEYKVMKDTSQFKECTRILKEAIEKGQVPRELFTPQQLDQIQKGRARIKGFTWHHHQVPGKMQLVLEDIHGAVNHLGGNKLWGEGIR
ncbi:HNH endonuclease, partial [Heyndrickxia sporothermodurans]